MAMTILVNGDQRDVEEGLTLATLLEQLDVKSRYCAVERNRELVPRAEHALCVLEAQDELEIVTLVGGG